MSVQVPDDTDVPAAWRTWYFSIGLPLCHGVSHNSNIVPAATLVYAPRFTGASGALGASKFSTGKSVKDAVSLPAASFSGFVEGFE